MTIILDGTNGITSPGETLTGTQVLAAGTTTVAPLDFTAGTNLTTPLAGAMEYDGKVIYATPQGTQRGVVPGAQFFRLDSTLAGANVNTAQSAFNVGVTLSSSTVYAFSALYLLSKTAGATSHAMQVGFGGTATVNNIGFSAQGTLTNAFPLNTATNYGDLIGTSTTLTTCTSATASATSSSVIKLNGTISVNAGGTLIPQYGLTVAPGGAYSMLAGSYFMIYPIGASGANTSVGTWA